MSSEETAITTPETKYTKSGDINIAYQLLGSGEVNIVLVPGWVSNVEHQWDDPGVARFLNRLASFSRLALFDKRGTGLSDRVSESQLPTLEQRMDDLRAVMDAVDFDKAALVGVSEGGPLCILFAATHPDRTSALITIGAYARRTRTNDYPWGVTEQQHEAFLDEIERGWGGPVGLAKRAPHLAGDESFSRWWSSYLRSSASPGAVLALTRMNAQIDVRSALPIVSVPALIIHRTDDQAPPWREVVTWPSASRGQNSSSYPATTISPGLESRKKFSTRLRNS